MGYRMLKLLRITNWTTKHGFINLLHQIRNLKMFDTPVIEEFRTGNSSITDSEYLSSYPSLCGSAAKDDEIFRKFRSAKVMVEALDHVSIEQGKIYLSEILKFGSWTKDFTNVIDKIDSIGTPREFRFAPYGTFSPTLLRYLKIHLDLENIFGQLQMLNIVEIGVGFGGQASVIGFLDQPLSYSFYDIPPVLELVKKFLNEIEVPGNFRYLDGRDPEISKPDLVVSNYAFSELNRGVQESYLNNVILNSSRGYITWNSLSADNLGGYSLAELLRLIPNSQILPERPCTAEQNVIIVWGGLKEGLY